MTDALEARAIEAARLAIDDAHDMDVSLDRYAEAAAKAVLWEVKTGSGDGHVAYLMARADEWIARGLYQGAKPLVPALRDALAAALTRAEAAECHAEAMEAERDAALVICGRLEPRAKALEDERDRLRAALEEAACYECTCDPAYYERNLAAPDCMANLVSDDAREALGMAAVCKGSAAARAALAGDPQP